MSDSSLTKSSSDEGKRGPGNQFATLNRQQGQDDGYDSRGGRSMSGQVSMDYLSHEQDAVLAAAPSMVGGDCPQGGSRDGPCVSTSAAAPPAAELSGDVVEKNSDSHIVNGDFSTMCKRGDDEEEYTSQEQWVRHLVMNR